MRYIKFSTGLRIRPHEYNLVNQGTFEDWSADKYTRGQSKARPSAFLYVRRTPLCILPYTADILPSVSPRYSFRPPQVLPFLRTFYPSSARSDLPPDVLPSSAGHLPNHLSLHFGDTTLRGSLEFSRASSSVVNCSIE